MAITSATRFVKIAREISMNDIRKQADQAPRLGIYGTLEERERLRGLLLGGSEDEADRGLLAQAVTDVDRPVANEEDLRGLGLQAIFSALPPEEALRRLRVPVFVVEDPESLRRAADRLADLQEDNLIGLGRFVAAFRSAIAERLITMVATANAEIALISALPGIVPVAELLLGPAIAADIVFLTKNQVMLVLKLAGVYNKPIQVAARWPELAPVIGSSIGWRALARELVGMVPAGIGVVAKGTVAYAGTYTLGKAAQFYYTRGRKMTRAEQKSIYTDALNRAGQIVRDLLARLRRKPETPPAGQSEDEDAA